MLRENVLEDLCYLEQELSEALDDFADLIEKTERLNLDEELLNEVFGEVEARIDFLEAEVEEYRNVLGKADPDSRYVHW